MRSLSLLGLIAGLSVAASAEDIAITGGTAYITGDEVIENATVLISDGKIERVKSGGKVPKGYRIIDASGKWVTVGLMVSSTTLGLGEVSSSAGIVDSSVKGAVKDTIALDVAYSLNPDSTLIPVTRIEGITRAMTGFSRTGNAWAGQGAVIHLGDTDDLIVKNPAFVGLNVSGSKADQVSGSRSVLWAGVYKKLEGAEPKKADKKKSKDEKGDKTPSAEAVALGKLFSGETTLVVEAHRKSDILQVIKLKTRFPDIRMVVEGGTEAWRVAERLAKADIGVILSGTSNLPGSFETLGATQSNATRLHAAGVTIAFIGDGSHRAKLMPQHAGNAVAYGLPWAAAFNAMTVNPAKLFGISESYGSLSKGMDADVVVWSGDPIEVTSHAEHVVIAGYEIELVSRQTKLRDRYLTLSRSPAIKQ